MPFGKKASTTPEPHGPRQRGGTDRSVGLLTCPSGQLSRQPVKVRTLPRSSVATEVAHFRRVLRAVSVTVSRPAVCAMTQHSCKPSTITWPLMAPVPPEPPSPATRARLTRQSRRDTVPELEIRRRLHARGIRYRVDARLEPSLRVRGDIVWRARRLVVFIDGCFWHGCPTRDQSPSERRVVARQDRGQRGPRPTN